MARTHNARKPVPVRSSPTAPARNTAPRGSGSQGSGGSRGNGTGKPGAQVRQAVPAAPKPATPAGIAPPWLQWTTFVLAIAGLGVSAFLTWEHFAEKVFLGCSENSVISCQAVTTSSWSRVFGIPVAVLGLVFFVVAVVPLMSPWAWRSSRREIHLMRLGSLVVGIGFVLYLVYAELQIGKICLYCTSVHLITFLLFALTVCAAALWGLDPAKAPSE